MGIKLNAANGGGSVELDVPSTVNSDLALTIPATAGEIVVKDSSGKVGIGTSSPQRDLHIHNASSSTNAYLQLTSATTGTGSTDGFQLWAYGNGGNTNAAIVQRENAALEIWTDNGEKMRITSNGDVCINTLSRLGLAKLSVKFNGTVENGICMQTTRDQNNSAFLIFSDSDGTTIGSVQQDTGSSIAYVTSSDYRLKENVVEISDGISRVKQLKPSRFNFIKDPNQTVDGFIAHEAQAVVPQAVVGEKDATKEEEYIATPPVLGDDGEEVTPAVIGTRTVPDHQGIDQSKLVPLLTAALKEAIAKIETLETKVAALEAK